MGGPAPRHRNVEFPPLAQGCKWEMSTIRASMLTREQQLPFRRLKETGLSHPSGTKSQREPATRAAQDGLRRQRVASHFYRSPPCR